MAQKVGAFLRTGEAGGAARGSVWLVGGARTSREDGLLGRGVWVPPLQWRAPAVRGIDAFTSADGGEGGDGSCPAHVPAPSATPLPPPNRSQRYMPLGIEAPGSASMPHTHTLPPRRLCSSCSATDCGRRPARYINNPPSLPRARRSRLPVLSVSI